MPSTKSVPWEERTLRCSDGCTFPVLSGVPRFVPRSTYADGFGLQWQKYARTQLDSYTGQPYSLERLEACLGAPVSSLAGKRVLEIGCGAGRFTEHLIPNAGLLVALDLSDAVEANLSNCQGRGAYLLVQADAAQPPLPEHYFDTVVCLGVLQHTADPVATLRAFRARLRPGGELVVDNYLRKHGLRRFGEYATAAYPLRKLLTRLSPAQALRVTIAITRLCDPIRRQTSKVPSLDRLVARVLPTACYYGRYDRLSPEHLYEWHEVDTHDMLTDAFKYRMTPDELADSLQRAGFRVSDVRLGGNGVEARAIAC